MDRDGFTSEFYKDNWDIIGIKVCNEVTIFVNFGHFFKGVKATAIILILKNSHASLIYNFRPISLCNVFHKIVAKLLINRLKHVLSLIIHDN